MLILARKLNEKIFIGDDITVQIVELTHNLVRIGINAPKDVVIVREELTKSKDKKEAT